jgi:signal transduction histidine kinase
VTLHDARDWLCLNAEGAAAARLATVFGGAREVTRRPQRWGWSQWPLGASTPDSGASGLHRDAMSSKRALLLFFVAAAQSQAPPPPQLARVACDAGYNAPCSRTNSHFLAWDVARRFEEQLAAGVSSDDVLARITAGQYNLETGFYPFVIDATTSVLLAHGERGDIVGQSLSGAFTTLQLQYSDPELLHARLVAAASTPGGQWVRYLWSTRRLQHNTTDPKEAFVVGVTREDGSSLLCLGVGFADASLPAELPCSHMYDGFCAMNNVRSLVGKAQTLLSKAESRANFEEALVQLSYNAEDFRLPGGFYIFTYSYGGPLVSHAVLHSFFGQSLEQILVVNQLGSSEDGAQLHQAFVAAAEGAGDGWVRYEWRNSLTEETYTKIALIAKVEFNAESYYVGAGFNFAMKSVEISAEERAEIRAESADAVAKLGALGEQCSPRFNLPCSVVNTLELSSHALAHVISSTASAAETFGEITSDPTFRTGDFYAFVYDFSSLCVAHGARSDFVGMTLQEVQSEALDMPAAIVAQAGLLHQQFKAAARAGGGWVQYEWAEAGEPAYQKLAYIFSFHRDGIEYYGGEHRTVL